MAMPIQLVTTCTHARHMCIIIFALINFLQNFKIRKIHKNKAMQKFPGIRYYYQEYVIMYSCYYLPLLMILLNSYTPNQVSSRD